MQAEGLLTNAGQLARLHGDVNTHTHTLLIFALVDISLINSVDAPWPEPNLKPLTPTSPKN